MNLHEQARAEAEKRWPTPDPRASQEEYDYAIASQGAFEDGAEWAATRMRVVTVDQLTDALYQATQDPDDIDVPDVVKRLHALLHEPEETR